MEVIESKSDTVDGVGGDWDGTVAVVRHSRQEVYKLCTKKLNC